MYTFDSSIENAQLTYEAVCEAYLKLFQLLDVPVIKGIFSRRINCSYFTIFTDIKI